MKNSYLNDMLNFGLELGVIQKKKKNENRLLKNLKKEENTSKI
jgi:hypothetical protein